MSSADATRRAEGKLVWHFPMSRVHTHAISSNLASTRAREPYHGQAILPILDLDQGIDMVDRELLCVSSLLGGENSGTLGRKSA